MTNNYDMATNFSEGLAAVRTAGSTDAEGYEWSLIDKTGKVVVSFGKEKYSRIGAFSEGLAPVMTSTRAGTGMTGGALGYIDKTGKEVIPAGSIGYGLGGGNQTR